jgi:hypothetical protein
MQYRSSSLSSIFAALPRFGQESSLWGCFAQRHLIGFLAHKVHGGNWLGAPTADSRRESDIERADRGRGSHFLGALRGSRGRVCSASELDRYVQLSELLFGDGAGSIHHLVAGSLGLGKGYHFPDVWLVP